MVANRRLSKAFTAYPVWSCLLGKLHDRTGRHRTCVSPSLHAAATETTIKSGQNYVNGLLVGFESIGDPHPVIEDDGDTVFFGTDLFYSRNFSVPQAPLNVPVPVSEHSIFSSVLDGTSGKKENQNETSHKPKSISLSNFSRLDFMMLRNLFTKAGVKP